MPSQPATEPPPHLVDQLIRERAPRLFGAAPSRWLMRRFLYPVLGYEEAVRIADAVAPLSGRAAMALLRRELGLEVAVHGLEHVPRRGRLMIVANHPTGLADGVALWQALAERRPDLRLFVNRDALRVVPSCADLFIPVEWVKTKRTHAGSREVFRLTAAAFRDEAALVMFPSGRLAYLGPAGIRERPWLPTPINLARKHHAPILPLHIEAQNSALFYGLSQLSRELRDVTLFHELLNKRGRRFEVRIGPPLNPASLPPDPAAAIADLQRYVESGLAADREPGRPMAEVRRARERVGTL